VDAIRDVVNRAVGQAASSKESGKKQSEDTRRKYELIGNHSSIQGVMDLVNRVAPTDSTVLIQGESGTGKELVARALHDRSPRQDGAFISVNCSAFTETLLESELFGHKKGAFTGAVADSEGFFRAADGGTLFLDEVADMSLTTQVKILRVLEERIVTPVGSTVGEPVNVRIVAATNKNILEEIRQGSFREDLYYRLNVIPVELPPLRDRKEDIPLLAGFFIRKHAERMGKELTGISEASIEKLRGYEWPGNVRELDNIIQRHVALSTSKELDSIQLRDQGQGSPVPAPASSQVCEFGIPDRGMDLEDRLEEIETGYLREALSATGGNMTEAARLLGMSYRSMRYRVKKLRVKDAEPVV
jgi:two-component system response regulator PilR (NtrC family)